MPLKSKHQNHNKSSANDHDDKSTSSNKRNNQQKLAKHHQRQQRLLQTIMKAYEKEPSYSDKFVRSLLIKQNTNDIRNLLENISKYPNNCSKSRPPPVLPPLNILKHQQQQNVQQLIKLIKITDSIRQDAEKQNDYLQKKFQIKFDKQTKQLILVPATVKQSDDDNNNGQDDGNCGHGGQHNHQNHDNIDHDNDDDHDG